MASGHQSSFGSFTTSCLDDIPFKIGTKFLPPQKIILPPNLELLKPSVSHALNAEYTFEVEEAVLKWSEERERQIEEQRRYEEERQAALEQQRIESANSEHGSNDVQNDTDGLPDSQHAPDYENTKELYPQPVSSQTKTNQAQPNNQIQPTGSPIKPYFANVQIPNPLLANISNDILKPVPINQASDAEPVKKIENSADTFDLSIFEQESDPFDNLELQTINDLEELKTVLDETNKASPSPLTELDMDGASDTHLKEVVHSTDSGNENNVQIDNLGKNIPLYENVDECKNKSENNYVTSKSDIDLTKLPPVPPRRDLVGRSMPLPPIGGFGVQSESNGVGNTTNISNQSVSQSWNGSDSVQSSVVMQNASSPKNMYDNVAVRPPNPLPKPPRHFKYSRHVDEIDTATDSHTETGVVSILPKSDNGASMGVQFRNTKSNPELQNAGAGGVARPRPVPAPRRAKSPPSRPSSGQPLIQLENQYPYSASAENIYSWNRYSPLPPPPVPSLSTTSNNSPTVAPRPRVPSPACTSSTNREPVKTPEEKLYDQLSNEAKTTVDNLVSMGFSKARVARAVQNFGSDEKEVVEHLCLVDQLTEKGHNVYLAETALLLFNNDSKKASSYLELFSQLIELGFNGEKIKEALVKTNIDREQTLDILTATS